MRKINEKNNLYEQFLKCSYWDLKQLFKKVKKEEQNFYITYKKHEMNVMSIIRS